MEAGTGGIEIGMENEAGEMYGIEKEGIGRGVGAGVGVGIGKERGKVRLVLLPCAIHASHDSY